MNSMLSLFPMQTNRYIIEDKDTHLMWWVMSFLGYACCCNDALIFI